MTAAELVLAFAKQASDRFNSLAASILPFVFVGKHDSHAAVKDQFQNTWEEAVGGSRAVLLYLKEILELSSTHLDSAQWTLKHTAARTVAASVMAVSASEAQISSDAAKSLWPSLEKALGGKTWEGKEVVLAAFVKFVQTGKSAYEKDSAVAAAIVKVSPAAPHSHASVCVDYTAWMTDRADTWVPCRSPSGKQSARTPLTGRMRSRRWRRWRKRAETSICTRR